MTCPVLSVKASVSLFLSCVTQRVMTSTIPELNNSFLANRRDGRESSAPKHVLPRGYVDCPEKEMQNVREL